MKILWIFWGVITKNGLVLVVISMHFWGLFLRLILQNGDILLVAKISFGGGGIMPDVPDSFGG